MAKQLSGTIKFYNSEKAFGFILPDGGGKDVFFHISGLGTEMILEKDVPVFYDEEDGKKGVQAVNIVPA